MVSIERKPEKLTRTILNLKNLILKLHVKIMDETGSIHNEYEYNNKMYLKIETPVYLSLEIVDDVWSKDKGIIITQNNLHGVRNILKRIINDIYNENIFANKPDGEVVAYKDMVEKCTRKLTLFGTNQQILIRPSVIYDDNDISYEGVILYINKFDNKAELSIELLEVLYYTLKQIDLFTYSQLLVNYYISYYKNNNEPVFSIKKKQYVSKPKVVFDNPTEEVTSTYRPNKEKNELFSGLNDE